MPRHLLVAVTPVSFGEVVCGLHLARQLTARGDHVSFLAPRQLQAALVDAPARVGFLDLAMAQLDRVIVDVAVEQRFDSIVLVDAASVGQTFAATGLSLGRVLAAPMHVVALDLWNLDDTGLTWDSGPTRFELPPEVRAVPRLLPSPLARPGTPNAFDGIGDRTPVTAQERRAARAELGLADDDRLVLWLAASWQSPWMQYDAERRHIARAIPELVVGHLARLGPRVRVLQVGSEAMPAGAALGRRFRWTPPFPPADFDRLLAATDVLWSLNTAATSTAAAIARGVPVVVGINSHAGPGATLPIDDPAVRRWASGLDLYPFRACPLGYHAVLEPVLANNPIIGAVRFVEVLDRAEVLRVVASLLFDDDARAQLAADQRAYAATVRALPSAAEVFDELIANSRAVR